MAVAPCQEPLEPPTAIQKFDLAVPSISPYYTSVSDCSTMIISDEDGGESVTEAVGGDESVSTPPQSRNMKSEVALTTAITPKYAPTPFSSVQVPVFEMNSDAEAGSDKENSLVPSYPLFFTFIFIFYFSLFLFTSRRVQSYFSHTVYQEHFAAHTSPATSFGTAKESSQKKK